MTTAVSVYEQHTECLVVFFVATPWLCFYSAAEVTPKEAKRIHLDI